MLSWASRVKLSQNSLRCSAAREVRPSGQTSSRLLADCIGGDGSTKPLAPVSLRHLRVLFLPSDAHRKSSPGILRRLLVPCGRVELDRTFSKKIAV